MRILTDSQEQLLQQERRVLNDLRVLLARFPAEGSDEKTLVDAIQQLDELFLLVVVGEFNSGKSAFINALLGQKLLKEGVTPTTAEINILHYGETQERALRSDGCLILKLPAEILKEISLVDTPGTNAVIREHETLTNQFVPRSDLVLFITSADRPFTESERAFLEQIRDWGKKVVIVINKIDIIEQAEEMEQVTAFVADNARRLLGADPQIFTVSARAALRAKLGEPALWAQSQFEPLETYIRTTLDETARLKLKFTSPLGVGNRLTEKYLGIAGSRLDLLKTDVEMLADVDRSLAVYQEDMQRDFQFRMADIENVLLEMEKRGDHFFDETFRLARVMDLLD
ncbi:GTP-binding protein, partial [bacterium]|nr:GTP-binding protein [bacterium]